MCPIYIVWLKHPELKDFDDVPVCDDEARDGFVITPKPQKLNSIPLDLSMKSAMKFKLRDTTNFKVSFFAFFFNIEKMKVTVYHHWFDTILIEHMIIFRLILLRIISTCDDQLRAFLFEF